MAAWLGAALRPPEGCAAGAGPLRIVGLRVEAIALDWKGEPVVVLREVDGERAVFIWISMFDATAISLQLEGQKPPRPLTHDLLVAILQQLQAEVLRVVISDVVGGTYYAQLELQVGDQTCSLDCRPSDGIAVAMRTDAPIFVEADLLSRLESLRAEGAEPSADATIVEPGEPIVH
jgi:bifunctional DNase/RNase